MKRHLLPFGLSLALTFAIPALGQQLSPVGSGGGGGNTTITSGAGDFGAATSQSGGVLTGTVTNGSHLTYQTVPSSALGASPAVTNNQYIENGQTAPTLGSGAFIPGGAMIVGNLQPPMNLACTCVGGSGTTRHYNISAVEAPQGNGSAGMTQSNVTGLAAANGPTVGGESAKASDITCSGPATLSAPSNYCTLTWTPEISAGAYKIFTAATSTTLAESGYTNTAYASGGGVGQTVCPNPNNSSTAGCSFTDYGLYATHSQTVYQSGTFQARGGVLSGDFQLNLLGTQGDFFVKDIGASTWSMFMGSTGNTMFIQAGTQVPNQVRINGSTGVRLDGGHVLMDGAAIGTVNSCGGTPGTPTGVDNDGFIVAGSTTASCLINFGVAWTTAPICMVQDNTTQQSLTSTGTTTAVLHINATAALGGDTLIWHCFSLS